ncbi:unnamed protein product [Bursaphelenchus xylophilus]|uniref:(pine wood nematode) hypothetical protein n=1 Tax=Bursaphelenchus xylophilus TaxID=6326 RepID=A0A1I7RIL8_BURXY|nr:unnamed protein product [Bursaphelenchus xylophilus]CAG9118886.1 unnamed protein product [Bursaphelenchus xylophilus]
MINLAASVRIEEQFASTVPEILLPVAQPDASNLSQWIVRAEALSNLFQSLVTSNSNVFWSTICLRPVILREIDHTLANFPFFEDLEDGSILRRAGQTKKIVNIFQNLWIVFVRLTVNWESEGVSEEEYKNKAAEHKIITLERLRLASGLFSKNFPEVMKRIIARIRKILPSLFNSVQKDLEEFQNHLQTLSIEVRSTHNRISTHEPRKTENVLEFLATLEGYRRRIFSWSEFLRFFPEIRCSEEMAGIIAEASQVIDESLNSRIVMNLGAESQEIAISLTRQKAAVLQALTHLFVRFYERSDETERIELLFGLRDQSTLLCRLEDRLKIKDKLPYLIEKSQMPDHGAIIKREIDKAMEKKSREVVENLENSGMLAHLGDFINPVVQENVGTLKDIVPYSTEFLHLVFRHYGYDLEKSIAALMEPDQNLPFNLRLLLKDSSNLKAAKPSQRQQINLKEIYEQDSEADSDHEDDADAAQKAQNIDIVQLLTGPVSSKAPLGPVLTEKEIKQRKIEEKLNKLMKTSGDLFNLRHLHGVVEKMQQIKSDQKITVNVGGKEFAKFRKGAIDDELDEADRTAIKEKSTAYKYELSDEDDEDGRYDLDAKFRDEVGASGRFNRGEVVAVSTRHFVDEEDEYDDSYDDVKIAVDENARIPEERHKASEYGYEGTQASGPAGGYAEEHERRQKLNKYNIPELNRPNANRPPEKAPKIYVARPPRTDQKQQSQAGPSGNPQPRSQKTSAFQPTAATSATKKDGYTGGKQRLNKERNKNKHKQRGADKKMARANPF